MEGAGAVWNLISTDFDPEEETANFGTRQALEAGGCLYEVVTMATVDPSTEVSRLPHLTAVTSNQHCILAVDCCLLLFSSSCSSCKPLQFQHTVDVFSVSPCGRFLLAGLRDGSVQLVFLPLERVLTSRQLYTAEGGAGERAWQCSTASQAGWALLTPAARLFTFAGLDLASLAGAVLAGDWEAARQEQANLQASSCYLVGFGTTVLTCLQTEQHSLLATDYGVFRLETGQTEADSDLLPVENCCQLLSSQAEPSVLFCLDSEGSLHIVCSLTRVILRSWRPARNTERVVELALLEDEGSVGLELLLLTKDGTKEQGGDQPAAIQILSWPGLTTTYRLGVAGFTRLVVTHPSQDIPLLVEGVEEEDALQPSLVTRLRIRGISEGVPEARLAKLLRRNKFKEAEQFAESFGLDKEEVWRSRSQHLLKFLSPWQAEDPASPHGEVVLELEQVLGKMRDQEWAVQLCLTAALPSLQLTRQFLLTARARLTNTEDELAERLGLKVATTLHRLETFTLTGAARKAGAGGEEVEEWLEFSRVDMMEQVGVWLSQGELKRAGLAWARHQAELQPKLDCARVAESMSLLKPDHPGLLAWLEQFLPDCLALLPACLPATAAWATLAVMGLEFSQRSGWPSCGLSLARGILDTMTFSRDDGAWESGRQLALLTLAQQRAQHDSPLSRLIQLVNSLEDLLVLHKQFRIKLKLSDFQDPVKEKVVGLILDWVQAGAGQEVPALMDGFLTGYMKRCGLDVSATLAEYCTALLESTSATWHWHLGPAPWEEKVTALAQHIHSVDRRAAVLLLAVCSAPVPWSEAIVAACQAGEKLKHRDSEQFVEQRSLVSLKTALRRQGWRGGLPARGRETTRLLQWLLTRSGASEDCILVADSVPGGATVLPRLEVEQAVRAGNPGAALSLLAGAEGREQLEMCRHTVDTAGLLLRLGPGEELEQSYATLLRGLAGLLQGLGAAAGTVASKADLLWRAWCLKTELGLMTAETDPAGAAPALSSPTGAATILQAFTQAAVAEAGEQPEQLQEVNRRLTRLCELAGLQVESAMGGLVGGLASHGKHQAALQLAATLSSSHAPAPSLADSWVQLTAQITAQLGSGESGEAGAGGLADTTQRLLAQSLTHCSPSQLADCLELAGWHGLACTTLHQTQDHDQEDWLAGGARLTGPQYRDRGLPLDRASCLGLVSSCLAATLPPGRSGPPQPFLPRARAASLALQDLDVTAPDPEGEEGTGSADAVKELAGGARQLVSQLQDQGHPLHGIQALQLSGGPLAALLLATEPALLAEIGGAVGGARSGLVAQLIPRVLADTKSDLQLGLALVSAEPKRAGLELLAKINKALGLDYRQVGRLAQLGAKFCDLHSLSRPRDQFHQLYVKACWGRRTSELGINFKGGWSGSGTECRAVLQEMVSHPKADLPTVRQFAEAFNIPTEDSLTLYSEALLGRLDREAVEGCGAAWEAVVTQLDRCHALLKDDAALYSHLVRMFSQVSPYNYALLELVLTRLQRTQAYQERRPDQMVRADRVRAFLLQYKRVAPPQPEHEVDLWNKERSTPFPSDLAKTRLPLYQLVTLPTKEKYKWLEKEFTLESYRSWLAVARLLGLAGDYICYFAVKNTVGELVERGWGVADNTSTWLLDHCHTGVLERISECIGQISDGERATAASHWVVQRLPRGADKVLASQGWEQQVVGWAERQPGPASQGAVVLAQRTRRQLQTEEALHRTGLADTSSYLNLAKQDNALQLVMALYEDPSIEARSRAAAGQWPDIARAAATIATINEFSLVSIKYELLDRWLPLVGAQSGSADDTLADMTLDLGVGATEEGGQKEDEVNLLRCVYLMQDCDQSDGLQYLLKLAFSEEGGVVSTGQQLRALQVLLSVCTEERLQEVTGWDTAAVRDRLDKLNLLNRLERLGLPYSLKALAACPGPQLVEAVWRAGRQSAEGLQLVRDLCQQHGVWGGQLWAQLLHQITNLPQARKDLRSTLLMLNGQPHLWNLPQFHEAWNSLLLAPFTSLIPPVSETSVSSCRDALQLLRLCPTVSDLELARLAGECERLQLPHLARLLLPYLAELPLVRSQVLASSPGKLEQAELMQDLSLAQPAGDCSSPAL